MFQCYIHANLVEIFQPVHEIWCTQALLDLNLALFCLCWGLTSQSTIFQSCRDGATASWVINQYFRGVKCLAQGHNTAAVGIEPPTSRSGVRHSTTEPPRSPLKFGSLSPAVTLKIRSKSPKPNQLFIMSQCYIHANLVKIHPPVHEISCKQ